MKYKNTTHQLKWHKDAKQNLNSVKEMRDFLANKMNMNSNTVLHNFFTTAISPGTTTS